jgi:hypothetical protein
VCASYVTYVTNITKSTDHAEMCTEGAKYGRKNVNAYQGSRPIEQSSDRENSTFSICMQSGKITYNHIPMKPLPFKIAFGNMYND